MSARFAIRGHCRPSSGALQTCYVYDALEHLVSVTMPRSTAAQTRTLTYDPATLQLTSENHPETALTCYFYTSDSANRGHNLLQKVVAKGNTPGTNCGDATGKTTQYSYDTYSRPTQISRFPEGLPEDMCQRTTIKYDQTVLPGGNAWGQTAVGQAGCKVIPASGPQVSQERYYFEDYSYNSLGQTTTKRLSETWWANGGTAATRVWDMGWTYNGTSEKFPDTVTYPATFDLAGALVHNGYTVTYGYDLMRRQSAMRYDANPANGTTAYALTSATYNAANQLLKTAGVYGNLSPVSTERSYNSLNQLEGMWYNGAPSVAYEYVGGQNNGKLAVLHDYTAGQTVSYQYGSLKRLASATAANAWSQSYTYDGFGNLTAKTGQSAIALPVDANTNRLGGVFCYDKFGNVTSDNGVCQALYTYDVANRLTGSGPAHGLQTYVYNAGGQRVAVVRPDGTEQVFSYGPGGQKMATISPAAANLSQVSENVFFAGQLWMQEMDSKYSTNLVQIDRLGSVRGSYVGYPGGSTPTPLATYLPFGEELARTTDGREKFATYTRDGMTGFDYANQRFYNSSYGRFMSPDAISANNAVVLPGNWNKYSYVGSDPINKTDPSGMCSPQDDPPCFSATGTGNEGYQDGGHGGVGGTEEEVGIGTAQGRRRRERYKLSVRAICVFKSGEIDRFQERFKQPCNDDFAALGTNAAAVQAGAANATFLNGIGSGVSQSSLYATSPVPSVVQAGSTLTGTVGSFIAATPGTVAMAQLGGSSIYLNAALINPNDYFQNISIVLHELLHNVTGLTDPRYPKSVGSLGEAGVEQHYTKTPEGLFLKGQRV